MKFSIVIVTLIEHHIYLMCSLIIKVWSSNLLPKSFEVMKVVVYGLFQFLVVKLIETGNSLHLL